MATVIATHADTLPSPDSSTKHSLPGSFGRDGHCTAATERRQSQKIAFPVRPDYTSWASSPSSRLRESSMPVSTGSQASLLASLPSFMSVFGDGSGNQQYKEAGAAATQGPNKPASLTKRPSSTQQHYSNSFRRDSTSTFESVESSPTTTISTAESLITEPSPSSSPESPNSSLPLPSLKSQRTNSSPAVHCIMESREQFSSSFPLLPGVERTESPNKKMRNTKNLSVNTAASNRQGSQLSKISLSNATANQSGHASSAPPTPAFIVPPKAPRKKPSNLGLTIATPESSSSNPPSLDRPAPVPQTPSEPQVRTLRLLQTTSTAPLFSPTHAPEGGMRLPPLGSTSSSGRFGKSSRPPLSVSPLSSFDNTVSSPITKQTLDHVQEETDYELPLSQEAKSPAYPQGPICIYDPNVYLYLEPTQVEARAFDVVLNVAREVKNPFTVDASHPSTTSEAEPQQSSNSEEQGTSLAGRDSVSEPQTAVSEIPMSSFFDAQPEDTVRTAPSTPKAIRPDPEYIHVPWDHNANVVDDLLRLCQVIEERVRQEKRVLIHCQCGVSRSASLVVAYGIYKNPQLTVQEAYDAVKTRSRWIGPNMNLIYQLSEFKTKLLKSNLPATSGWHSWRSLAPLTTTNSSLVADGHPKSARVMPQKSLSAPSHVENNGARTSSFGSGSNFLTVHPTAGDITPGPSSAPPHMAWLPSPRPMEAPSSLTLGDEKSAESIRLPKLMDLDSSITLSPIPVSEDTVHEKETPPAGGVANDLQEVAKDLNDRKIPELTESSGAKPMDLDIPRIQPSAPVLPSSESRTMVKPPSPALPAGFSSLLSRRQGPQRLPLRQELPRFPAAPAPQPIFNPVLHDDVPPTPSLLSPRAAEFTASPFHRTVAGDLAGSSVFEQGLMSPTAVSEDPRSPHQKGEAPITRSIFDILDSKKPTR